MSSSLAASLALRRPSERERLLTEAGFPPGEREQLVWSWRFWGRPEQQAPAGDWRTWLVLAGRGFGKTRAGAETVVDMVRRGVAGRIALVAPTAADTRDVMVEGPSGVIARSPPWCAAVYEPSKRRVTWSNGAVATLFSADEPDRLRGPQHDLAWADELAAWRYPDAWDQLQFGMRVGDRPRVIVTTTPRPTPIIRALLKASDTVKTGGATHDNAANLPAAFLRQILGRYEGTRLGRQEIHAEVLAEVEGALWTHEMLEALRVDEAPQLERVVVAVDPSGGQGDGHDEQGIGAAGRGVDGDFYALEDWTCSLSPEGWSRRAVELAQKLEADAIVYEANYGGDMVASTLKTAQRELGDHTRLVKVTASRGKHQRAEPVAALYEQKHGHHVGAMPKLEDELVLFTPQGFMGDRSPNRADWLIWAATELMLGGTEGAWGIAGGRHGA